MTGSGRTPEDLLFEAEYVRALNSDCRELLDLIYAAADALARQAPATMLMIPHVRAEEPMGYLEQISTGMRDAMHALQAIQAKTIAIGETVGGRIRVLMDEMGLEPGGAEE